MITVTADSLGGIRNQLDLNKPDVIMVLRARPPSWEAGYISQGPKPRPGCIIELHYPCGGEVPLLFKSAVEALEWIEQKLKERDADVERALSAGPGVAPR